MKKITRALLLLLSVIAVFMSVSCGKKVETIKCTEHEDVHFEHNLGDIKKLPVGKYDIVMVKHIPYDRGTYLDERTIAHLYITEDIYGGHDSPELYKYYQEKLRENDIGLDEWRLKAPKYNKRAYIKYEYTYNAYTEYEEYTEDLGFIVEETMELIITK